MAEDRPAPNIDLLTAEMRVQQTALVVVSYAHRMIWREGKFTSAEARLCWLEVIKQMVESVWIERKGDVVAESLKEPVADDAQG